MSPRLALIPLSVAVGIGWLGWTRQAAPPMVVVDLDSACSAAGWLPPDAEDIQDLADAPEPEPLHKPEGAAAFGGVWGSTWGPLSLEQRGDRVVGNYQWGDTATPHLGRLEGAVEGDRLTFRWTEDFGGSLTSGDGYFLRAADGQSFAGVWRHGTVGAWAGEWTGRLLPREPTPEPEDALHWVRE